MRDDRVHGGGCGRAMTAEGEKSREEQKSRETGEQKEQKSRRRDKHVE